LENNTTHYQRSIGEFNKNPPILENQRKADKIPMSSVRNILIVEDDTTLANAMATAVKKLGYKASVTAKPDEAIELVDRDRYAIVFIDCLLPQMPGMELAKKIRQNFSAQILPIVLMSGIFTDKTTVKEMINEIQAKDFLKKPFDLSEVTKHLVKEVTMVRNESLRKNSFTIFERIYEHPDEMEEELKSIEHMHGFEIPLLMTVLVEMHFSGTVFFQGRKSGKSKVVFFKGNIIQVGSEDSQSFIGRLLLSKGFVFIDELESILKISSNKKVATRLVEENLLSPHALDEVLQEQMFLRLSKIICDERFDLTFEFHETIFDGVSILVSDFAKILEDWINSRISSEWLGNEFMKMTEYSFRMGNSYRENHPYLNTPLVQNLTDFLKNITKVQSFNVMSGLFKSNEAQFYRAFYFSICAGLVVFTEKAGHMSDDERFARLQKMSIRLAEMDLIETFEFMGGRIGVSEAEVKSIYEDFSKKYLGNHSGVSGIAGFSEVYYEVKRKIDMAYNLFMNPREVKNYEQKLQAKKATDQIKAQEVVQEAKKLLSLHQFQKAYDILMQISSGFTVEYKNLYIAWAMLGLIETAKNKNKIYKDVELILTQTTAEEKVSALGNFINGLLAKARGEYAFAKKSFETAMALDRNFIEARRELNNLGTQGSGNKTPDLLRGDLKDVVNFLFKGTKK
jgi:DNA-binding response OmpR family regulator